MHFVKHEHTECPAPINQWFPIKPSHHVCNAGCLAVSIADKTGCASLHHFQLPLLVYVYINFARTQDHDYVLYLCGGTSGIVWTARFSLLSSQKIENEENSG